MKRSVESGRSGRERLYHFRVSVARYRTNIQSDRHTDIPLRETLSESHHSIPPAHRARSIEYAYVLALTRALAVSTLDSVTCRARLSHAVLSPTLFAFGGAQLLSSLPHSRLSLAALLPLP